MPDNTSAIILPGVTHPRGFRGAGGACGIKATGKPDLVLIVADKPCAAAGVFTTSKVPGAPVIVSRQHVRGGSAQAIVVNSGCSNVATGQRGVDDATTMCQTVAKLVGCKTNQVLVCSTGVIGRFLPMDKINKGIGDQFARLARGSQVDVEIATAILTTDLVTKVSYQEVKIGETTARIAGIAKGSGMIQPNMATMLAFITTDAAISPAMLRAALKSAAAASFNRISVDHDTSTSDTVLALASGAAGHKTIATKGKAFSAFEAALLEVCKELAEQIVRDGEGATKLFRVKVTGAKTVKDADKVGYCVTGSPLVKTAVHGADPNWGRLAMAVGRSGAAVNPAKLSITIGGIPVFVRGVNVDPPLTKLTSHMRGRDIEFIIDLGLGKHAVEWLGCDLSREYIAINADYTS